MQYIFSLFSFETKCKHNRKPNTESVIKEWTAQQKQSITFTCRVCGTKSLLISYLCTISAFTAKGIKALSLNNRRVVYLLIDSNARAYITEVKSWSRLLIDCDNRCFSSRKTYSCVWNCTIVFFHISHLFRWIIQKKIYKNLADVAKDLTQVTCLADSYRNHYTRMFSVPVCDYK